MFLSIKPIFYITIIFILIINLILINQKRINQKLIENFNIEHKKIRLENSKLSEYILNRLEKRKMPLYLSNPELQKLLNQSHYLVGWRYYENNCGSCIEEAFMNLKKYSKYIGVENIVIVTFSNNIQELKASFSGRKMDNYKIITIPDYEFNISLGESENVPFYFVIDKKGDTDLIFCPDIGIPKLTENYFEKIIEKFSKQ